MKKRVLVVDDDEDIVAVARVSLEVVGGFEVESAGCGYDAVRAALASPPDAVLLDLMMPGTDGLTVARSLRAHPSTRHVPIVVLTARPLPPEDQARDVVDGMLSKPFDPMALPALLAASLGWPL